jgi:hypothetical protein
MRIDFMPLTITLRRWTLWTCTVVSVLGCSDSKYVDSVDERPDYSKVVPTKGLVTLNGQPLPHAVVMFLPPRWMPGGAETDENGKYEVEMAGRRGVLPGRYKVSISYLVSDDGVPLGMQERYAMRDGKTHSPALLTAKERFPREYSDPTATKLIADVGADGGTFDYKLEVPGVAVATKKGAANQDKDATQGADKSGPTAEDKAAKSADKKG